MSEHQNLPDIVERLRVRIAEWPEDDWITDAMTEIERLRSFEEAGKEGCEIIIELKQELDMNESIRTYQKLLHEYIDTLAARDRQIKHLLEDGEGLREAVKELLLVIDAEVSIGPGEYITRALDKVRAALSSGRDGGA